MAGTATRLQVKATAVRDRVGIGAPARGSHRRCAWSTIVIRRWRWVRLRTDDRRLFSGMRRHMNVVIGSEETSDADSRFRRTRGRRHGSSVES